jgi:hypothetical protein
MLIGYRPNMTYFCPRCGGLFLPNMDTCYSCGWKQGDSEESEPISRPVPQPKVVDNEDPDLPFFPYKPRDMQVLY